MSTPETQHAGLTATANVLAAGRGRPRILHRESVIRTALDIVERDGLGALTIRRLATELGVGSATVTNAAGNKDDILGGLVDAVIARVPGVCVDADRWEANLVELFEQFHEVLLAHPEVARLAAVQPTSGPVILRTQETILELLRCAGLDDGPTAEAYTTLTSYLMGFTLLRISRSGLEPEERESKIERDMRQLPATTLPQMHALAHHLALQTTDEHFSQGLRRLIRSFGR